MSSAPSALGTCQLISDSFGYGDTNSWRYRASPLGPSSGAMRSSASLISSLTSVSTVRFVSRIQISAQHLLTVFIQAQRTARVLDKEVQQPDLIVLDLRHSLQDLIRDQVRAPRLGLESKLLLRPHGGGGLAGFRSWGRCWSGAAKELYQAERRCPDVMEKTWKKCHKEN